MIDRILDVVLKQRLLVLLVGLAFVAWGLTAMLQLPIDAFPDITNVQVQVVTEARGMAPEEVENLATVPVESVMNGIPRVQNVRSVSMAGLSQVTVVFEDGVDIYFARQQVQERLNELAGQLTASLGSPTMGPVTVGIGTIYRYTLEGPPGYDPKDLHTLQNFLVKRQLKTVPGVADVITFGGLSKEYQVRIDPDRLKKFGATLAQVYDAVAANNANVGAGVVNRGSEAYLVRGIGLVKNEADIGSIALEARGGTPVLVRDVAEVVIGSAAQVGTLTKNGEATELTSGVVLQRKGESTRTVMARVQEKLDEINRSLPPGVKLVTYYDQTELIGKTIHTVGKSLLEGGILVVVVLVVFLGNLRAGLLVAVTIPLSLLFAFIMMERFGFSANLMTLGAIDFGMIVDGSVVMVENIFSRLAHRQADDPRSTDEIVLAAAKEVGRPILFAIAIIILVYLPLMSLQGIEGKFFAPMAFTVSFALFGSLLCALTLVPVLCSLLLRGPVHERENRWFGWLKARYVRGLALTMDHRWRTIGAAGILLAGALVLVPFLGSEFMPELDEGAILLRSVKLPSISLAESRHLVLKIERAVRQFPEVETVVSRTGRAEGGFDPEGFQIAHTEIKLKPRETWRFKSKEALVEAMSEAVKPIPGAAFTFTQPIADMIDDLMSGAKAQIAVKVFGDDLQELQRLGNAIQKVMGTIDGVGDLSSAQLVGQPQLQVVVLPEAAARYGISIRTVQDVIQMAVGGKTATQVIDGPRRFDVTVRYQPEARQDAEAIGNIEVPAPGGGRIALKRLTRIQDVEGTAEISRENGLRRQIVSCNVRGRDIGGFVSEAKAKIARQVVMPAGYFVTWGGQAENQARATQRLAIVVPLVIVLIFFLLYATFNSFRHAGLIILNLPFALIGGIAALTVTGLHLSVAALIGFIALFGVSVQNGVIMVSRFNALRQEGMDLDEAVRTGAEDRFRPVLMTALVASLGFIPMALATGVGAEIPKPLATVVIGGLISSTALTLFLLPVLYRWVEARAHR
ncbi:MAG: efflux RND transporter permease subunit [Candidatus Sericytochromatia bacterium]|nr:efflux RND transporter permease subunit [Candidatus Sericytochromatia bacterium]